MPLPLPVLILIGGVVSGMVGLGMGYLTLRLRGAFFSIATLALAVVLQTLVINWDFVGGSRGAYIIRPATAPLICGSYIDYLFLVMLGLAVVAIVHRAQRSSARGSASASPRSATTSWRPRPSGVPTLRLKLIATDAVGRAHGHGRRAVSLLRQLSRSGLGLQPHLCRQLIAMPLIGGTTSWIGPLIGAVLLGTLAAVRHRHHLLGAQPADRRAAAGRLRHRRAQRHRRAGRAAALRARSR